MDKAEQIYRRRKKTEKGDIEKWRQYWREAGPIRFAEEYLFCPPNVPAYPDWEKYQEERYCIGCKKVHKKFHDTGIPVHVILSPEQVDLLLDVWIRGIRLVLVSAGRGAGKTFTLGVWDCWRLATLDYYEITCMGGSQGQSKLIQKYMDYWRLSHKEIGYIVYKSPKAIGNRGCLTRMGSEAKFIPCSPTAAMGPHVDEVQIDEVCSAEAKGVEGEEAIEAVDWQVTGRKDAFVWMTSTSHFLLGKFFEYLKNPDKYGFKVYFWSIAKHISGKPVHTVYTDRNPEHWIPAVWWITKKEIQKLRKRKSNEEWLCWALGRPSLASGAIFKRTDIDNFAVCNLCEDTSNCQPYKWGHCKLIEKYKLGTEENPTKFIIDRKAGWDYGDPAPCALLIGGIKGKRIFILYAEEQKGMASNDLIRWVLGKLKFWKTYTFNPDPSIAGKHVKERVDEEGYAVNILDIGAKEERVQNVKSIVENHSVIIPPIYWHLINSLRVVHRDKKGRIVKYNDHSFDAFCYVCVDWGDMEGGSVDDVFDVMMERLGEKMPDFTEEEEKENESREDIIFSDKTKGLKFWND